MWVNILGPAEGWGYLATTHREGCMYTVDREASSTVWEQVDDLAELGDRTPHHIIVKPCSMCFPGTPTWTTTNRKLREGASPEELSHLIIVYSQVFRE